MADWLDRSSLSRDQPEGAKTRIPVVACAPVPFSTAAFYWGATIPSGHAWAVRPGGGEKQGARAGRKPSTGGT